MIIKMSSSYINQFSSSVQMHAHHSENHGTVLSLVGHQILSSRDTRISPALKAATYLQWEVDQTRVITSHHLATKFCRFIIVLLFKCLSRTSSVVWSASSAGCTTWTWSKISVWCLVRKTPAWWVVEVNSFIILSSFHHFLV